MAQEWIYGDSIDLTNGGANDLEEVVLIENIPSRTVEIEIMLDNVVTDEDSVSLQVRLGTNLHWYDSGYESAGTGGVSATGNGTTGIRIALASSYDAGEELAGIYRIYRYDPNQTKYMCEFMGAHPTQSFRYSQGTIELNAELTRIMFTTDNALAQFQQGTMRVRYRTLEAAPPAGPWIWGNPIDLSNSFAADTTPFVLLSDLPTGVTDVQVFHWNAGVDAADALAIQLGDAGGFETTGYDCCVTNGSSGENMTEGFMVDQSGDAIADAAYSGVYRIQRFDGNLWIFEGIGSKNITGTAARYAFGTKTLSGELTQVQISSDAGTALFTKGMIIARYM